MRGFTVIELLVVGAVLILAASLVFLHFQRSEHQSSIMETQSDLEWLAQHIEVLYRQTGMGPGHVSREPCVRSPEVSLNSCEAGLKCTDGAFPNWQGPYLEQVPKDPWGHSYYFDADYLCKKGMVGCGGVPNSTKVRAILSGGPNGSFDYDQDNIVHIICK